MHIEWERELWRSGEEKKDVKKESEGKKKEIILVKMEEKYRRK